MTRAPLFFTEKDDLNEEHSPVLCNLCHHKCRIKNGNFGVCKVRGNKNGNPIIPFSGFITSLANDPIEKKPLYHFKPGTQILSIGFCGCNMSCPFCQNWHISQNTDISGKYMKPGEIISAALRQDSSSIAYTYSEPLIHAEFLLDCMTLAHTHGIANVLVTNGCINKEAAFEILKLTDAANIDLKCFNKETYSKTLGGNLDTVIEFINLASSLNVHTEITTLIVPGLNDSDDELDAIADYIAGLCGDNYNSSFIPWHLSAYHTDYRWNAPATEPKALIRFAKNAEKKLKFVFTGNISSGISDTVCSVCNTVLVQRRGYRVDTHKLVPPAAGEKKYQCSNCGAKTDIIY